MVRSKQAHWQAVYQSKETDEVSWYQSIPRTSLDFIQRSAKDRTARIIDIGGGDSNLVDHLIKQGFSELTILDISDTAINRTKDRLKGSIPEIEFIVTDVTAFKPSKEYDVWHDRAAFHFLTNQSDQEKYISILKSAVKPEGHVILATFAIGGATKCSGLPTEQYDCDKMELRFGKDFKLLECNDEIHQTPSGSEQLFKIFWLQYLPG